MDENRIKEYTLENGQTFTAYIPENVSSNTPVFYYSYVVGSDYETDKLWRGMEEDMARYNPNAIIIIPHDKQLVIGGENVATHKYQTNAVNAFNMVKEDLNLETNQFINGGFSAGFGYGTRTLAHYLQENPDAERQVLFAVDGVINPTANLQNSELQALKDNNTIIISFTQQKNHNYQANLFKSTGLPILYVVDNSIPENTPDSQYWRIHDQVATDFYDKGLCGSLIDFALGKSNIELPEGYSLRYYDPETEKIREITSEEAAQLMNIKASSIVISPKRLSALATLENLNIESNDEVLETYLNEIRGAIRKTSYLQGDFSSNFTSTTQIPSILPSIVNQFFAATTTLLETIAEETAQFAKIGTSLVEQDNQMTQEAEQITEVLEQNTTTSPVISTINSATVGLTAGITSAVKEIKDKVEDIANNTNKEQPSNSSQNVVSNNKTNTNSNQQSLPSEKTTTSTKEFYNYENLYSDATKIVYNYNDEYKVIIHKDGNRVTGIEYYYDYGTEEKALSALESLKKTYSSEEYFEQLLQKDRYVKVIFKDEMYKDLSIEQIKEKYSKLEEIVRI